MAGLTKEQKAAKALLAKAIELSGLSAEAFEALGEQERADWSKSAQDAIDLVAADAQRLADEAAAAKPKGKSAVEDDEPDYTGLVKVEQGGQELHVHPSCLDDHKRLGWKEV
ncbi:hypothetical protein GCM10009091_34260 [Pseudomonas brenneri]|uniref:Uncharacterized protein n=1 Tax=Pseudomonas brenneri TaxID=129817 RepID=A0A5B2UTN9_9PSED|nr:hypothetical protein [Pseudomonas brenneri]KAA2230513.1 hypothetical protein F1720_11020 [Pseudomonas brenneri]TWR77389.1 hypothetical protein FJD34_17065 [Pseudomonas brenneri]GGL49675.1 hypothetical protein GCM10009091_34260 [Pseudomonas brenneri]SDU96428.1 hypothetical protein SAMN04490181_2255 [Pseudomonas brenneri]